jgi:ribosomal protein S6
MAQYELMLIINPSVSQDDRDSSINNVKAILEKSSAKIEKEDIW